MKTNILKEITNHYLNSSDFNGLHSDEILGRFPNFKIHEAIVDLIKEQKIDLVFPNRHPNPHIKAFDAENADLQLKMLASGEFESYCIYPSKVHLRSVIDDNFLNDRPFSKLLAIGEPQLGYRSFPLEILESYKNDPRYYFECDDIQGKIFVSNDFLDNPEFPKKDQILLQTFGFSYSENVLNRHIAVFLRYLAKLTPEHQMIWFSKICDGEFFLHPMYAKMTMGHWIDEISVLSAILLEQKLINQICDAISMKPFFLNVPEDNQRPTGFTLLFRPTQIEFDSFIHCLDKLFSDNINPKFFPQDIPREYDETRKDGRVEVKRFGTIKLLEKWLGKFKFQTPELANEMIATFQEIRQKRQKPAHKLQNNIFNHKFFSEQIAIAKKAYRCVKILRQIFQLIPGAQNIEIPRSIANEKICAY